MKNSRISSSFHCSSLLVLLFFLIRQSPADIHYIVNGASGNGSSWDAAYGSLSDAGLDESSSTSIRGDTFYVAGSSTIYNGATFKNSPSSDQPIYILKATEQNHGTNSGWKPEFGSLSARFRPSIRFETDDWVFDGATGGGPGSWDKGYGFQIIDSAEAKMTKLIRLIDAPDNITIRHVDCFFAGCVDGTSSQDLDAFYAYGGSSNVTLSYCAFRYAGRDHVFLSDARNLTVEYCYHQNNRMCNSQHAQSWEDQGSDSVTVRFNLFDGCRGTGVIVVLSRGGNARESNFWRIYGNIFINNERGYVTDGIVAIINDQIVNEWTIANNTFHRMKSQFTNVGLSFSQSDGSSSGIVVLNNLWYECDPVVYSGSDRYSIADYSYFINTEYRAEDHAQHSDSDPFKGGDGFNFSLANPSESGAPVPEPINIDMFNQKRGADGHLDRGAIEYNQQTTGIQDFHILNSTDNRTTVNKYTSTFNVLGRTILKKHTASGCYLKIISAHQNSFKNSEQTRTVVKR